MTILATILISCMLAVCGSAQLIVDGSCPKLSGAKDFSTAKFAGRWHEARRFYSKIEEDSKCNSATYSTTDSDHSMTVEYRLINKISNEPLKMNVNLNFKDPKMGEYTKLNENITDLVLATDYENFAILWNCEDSTQSHTENAWIITRATTPSEKTIAEALKSFKSFGLDKSKLIVSDQADC